MIFTLDVLTLKSGMRHSLPLLLLVSICMQGTNQRRQEKERNSIETGKEKTKSRLTWLSM